METLPPGIRRVKTGYTVDVQEGKVRKRVTEPTLEQAIQTRAILRAELVAATRDVKTLQDCYDQADREQWSRSKSTHSYKGTIYNAKVVLAFFGPLTPVSVINRSDITAFDEYLRLERNVSDSTINRYHAPLSTMLTIAEEHGWIDRKPLIKHNREPLGRIRWLSDDEEHLMLGQVQRWGLTDHADAFMMLLDTGLRPGELWQLGVKDCDLTWVGTDPHTGETAKGQMHIWFNKTDLPRSLPCTSRVYDILKRRSFHTQDLLFPFHNEWFRSMWERVKMVTRLKDDTLVPYCCRHTCATRLLQRGMTLPELQQWLGHKSLQMTMRYAHLSPTALVKGVRLLEQQTKEVSYDTISSGSSLSDHHRL